ncbi:MAG: 3-phosphoshikimate 1-carboxyvinyltransferase [Chloroflexota bacterium]|nr:3-phosphoshikimate 1-carboxyvinyltransferase [Chloroflexota bacterium]
MIELNSSKKFSGSITIPSDKSISHRSAILNSVAFGEAIISNFSNGNDCLSTLNVLSKLGVQIDIENKNEFLNLRITGNGYEGLTKPDSLLDAGNSGTTTRLMSGILSSLSFETTISGDNSLNSRPMKRIIDPLSLMGAEIISNDNKAPLTFKPSNLNGINYEMNISSAQVKSCIMLAGLNSHSETVIKQPSLSRDHTERMLEGMGANIKTSKLDIIIEPSKLNSVDLTIPGDVSSASFWMVAALIHPNSNITLKNVGMNPLRTGIIDILKKMGGKIIIEDERIEANEPVANIKVMSSDLNGVEISGEIIPKLIDEIPIIIIAASIANGTTYIKNAEELRYKETDRLLAMSKFLEKSKIEHTLYDDGIKIFGNGQFIGGEFDTYDDHRIAMSVAISSIIAKNKTVINDHEVASISYKNFYKHLEQLKFD